MDLLGQGTACVHDRTFLMISNCMAEFHDTWAFLDNRVKDAFDLKKTMQEVVAAPILNPYFTRLRFLNVQACVGFGRQSTWLKLLVQEWEALCKDLLKESCRDDFRDFSAIDAIITDLQLRDSSSWSYGKR